MMTRADISTPTTHFLHFLPAAMIQRVSDAAARKGVRRWSGAAIVAVRHHYDALDICFVSLGFVVAAAHSYPPCLDRSVLLPIYSEAALSQRLAQVCIRTVTVAGYIAPTDRTASTGVRLYALDLEDRPPESTEIAVAEGSLIRVDITIYVPHAVGEVSRLTCVPMTVDADTEEGSALRLEGQRKLDRVAKLTALLAGAPVMAGAIVTIAQLEIMADDGVVCRGGGSSVFSVVDERTRILLNNTRRSKGLVEKEKQRPPLGDSCAALNLNFFSPSTVQVARRCLRAAAQVSRSSPAGVLFVGAARNGKTSLVELLALEENALIVRPTVDAAVVVGGDNLTEMQQLLCASLDAWLEKRSGSSNCVSSQQQQKALPSAIWLCLANAEDEPAVGSDSGSGLAALWWFSRVSRLTVTSRFTSLQPAAPAVSSAPALGIVFVLECRGSTQECVSQPLLGSLFNNRVVEVPMADVELRTVILRSSMSTLSSETVNILARKAAGQSLYALLHVVPSLVPTDGRPADASWALRVELPDVARGASEFAVDLRKHTLASFESVGGLADVKGRLHRALILPLMKPEVFERMRLSRPKGVLLYGPPGCAKTTLVKALCRTGSFALLYLDCASVLSAYVGESEEKLRSVFRSARERAPAIIFFDEVDAIAASRTSNQGAGGSGTRLLATLLIEMDGMTANPDVCFIGATNLPFLLDPAIVRPGRFDELLFVPLPRPDERLAIVEAKLRPLIELALGGESCDVALPRGTSEADAFVAVSRSMSGADITGLCRELAVDFADGRFAPVADSAAALWADVLRFLTSRITVNASVAKPVTGRRGDTEKKLRQFIARFDPTAAASAHP